MKGREYCVSLHIGFEYVRCVVKSRGHIYIYSVHKLNSFLRTKNSDRIVTINTHRDPLVCANTFLSKSLVRPYACEHNISKLKTVSNFNLQIGDT